METINDRISMVVKQSGMNKTSFAAAVHISQSYLSELCSGKGKNPSDRTISDICKTFNVSEPWLRTGQGEMYLSRPREEQIAELVGQALTGSSEFKKAVIQMICTRSDAELQALEAALRAIFENL